MKIPLLGWELRFKPLPLPAPPSPPPATPALTPLDVIQSLAEGLLAVDKDRRVLLANNALEPLLNRPPREAAGRPLWEVLRHREVNEMAERALVPGNPPELREIAVPLPVETVWRVCAAPLAAGAVLTFIDLTQLKRLEAVRKDFVANVSHELKTPLTSLRASLETLLDGALEDPDHARDFLETAQAQVQRLQDLIEDLLALSRLERGVLPEGKASLKGAAERALATLRPLAEKAGVALAAELPGVPVDLALPEDELSRVLLNLLDNAVKFNQPGGRAALSAKASAGSVEIAVSDTGIGIPPEDQPRVFERFYRVDKARTRDVGGTGLGLAIVKHIVENRKGSIRLDSAPGGGSTFIVTLPIA